MLNVSRILMEETINHNVSCLVCSEQSLSFSKPSTIIHRNHFYETNTSSGFRLVKLIRQNNQTPTPLPLRKNTPPKALRTLSVPIHQQFFEKYRRTIHTYTLTFISYRPPKITKERDPANAFQISSWLCASPMCKSRGRFRQMRHSGSNGFLTQETWPARISISHCEILSSYPR